MESASFSDNIALLALLVAFGALAWNVVRDFILDRVSVDFETAFGESGNIKNSSGVFADAGSFKNHHIAEPEMLVTITNTGRRPIAVSNVRGEYKTENREGGTHFSVMVAGIPKMLQPYEMFGTFSKAKSDFLEQVQKDNLKRLWVEDTAGGQWDLSPKGWKRLRSTAAYLLNQNTKT